MYKYTGFSRITLSKIEKGDPSVSTGSYASSLFILGMIDQLSQLVDASHDIIGRELEKPPPIELKHQKKDKMEPNEQPTNLCFY